MKFKLLIALLVFSINFYAQSPGKIIGRANKALGGEKALKAIATRQAVGKITRLSDGATGNYQSQAADPNLYNEGFDLNGFEIAAGFNGKSGWMRDSRDGLRTLTGNAGRNFQAEAAYRNSLWLNAKADKSKLISGGQLEIRGKTANLINITTSKGVQLKLYFDAATGLPLREEIPQGEIVKTLEFEDFRNVGGVLEPFTILAGIGDEKYEIKLDSIRHNVQLAKQAFDFPRISNEPLPDIRALLQELTANEEKLDNILDQYGYTLTTVNREVGKDGVMRQTGSETYQLSFFKGYRIRRLTAKNDRPLSANDQEDEDKKATKRVEEIEKEIAKRQKEDAGQTNNGPPRDNARRLSVAEILRASLLINPRRERFRGREVIVFDVEPNPNFDLKNASSLLKFFGKIGGAIWIDEKDKQVTRIEGALFDSFKVGGGLLFKIKEGGSFYQEKVRINDEIWLPLQEEINFVGKALLVRGINVNVINKYSGYSKFTSEVKEGKVTEKQD